MPKLWPVASCSAAEMVRKTAVSAWKAERREEENIHEGGGGGAVPVRHAVSRSVGTISDGITVGSRNDRRGVTWRRDKRHPRQIEDDDGDDDDGKSRRRRPPALG